MLFFNLYCAKKCIFVENLTTSKCFALGVANLTISADKGYQIMCQPEFDL